MVAILKETQCLTMLTWRPVFQNYPDAIAGRGGVLMILTETHRCDVDECEERNDFIRVERGNTMNKSSKKEYYTHRAPTKWRRTGGAFFDAFAG
ncbi:hypothetical protein AVEN_159757-1 [Araneus ventricosus]|uniref:Uncharacterized protein n=1 Tax=Araneus ventricosus TaxID=182803 RepID=A0A4Y2S4U9_ARAVE|nr:hypothetical protein AVEN_159757-1 [Araneus ventricosus]